jgi:hypothetical protein
MDSTVALKNLYRQFHRGSQAAEHDNCAEAVRDCPDDGGSMYL